MDIFDAIAAGKVPPPQPSKAPTQDDLSEAELNVTYKLCRHVPDMARGFTIGTNYGEFTVVGDLARRIQEMVRKDLEGQLRLARHVRPTQECA